MENLLFEAQKGHSGWKNGSNNYSYFSLPTDREAHSVNTIGAKGGFAHPLLIQKVSGESCSMFNVLLQVLCVKQTERIHLENG